MTLSLAATDPETGSAGAVRSTSVSAAAVDPVDPAAPVVAADADGVGEARVDDVNRDGLHHEDRQ